MTPPDPSDLHDDDDGPIVTYPGAPRSLVATWKRRRAPMAFIGQEGLPPLDVDLDALMATPIPADEPEPTGRISKHGMKLHKLRAELAGKPELAALNAILIAHLRKKSAVPHAPALFHRIWREKGADLMLELPGRWLISSVITFADHGETEAQRRIGQSLNVLFSVMKLYEAERLMSGADPRIAAPLKPVGKARLPLGMPSFALIGGGLDINLLAPLWKEAQSEPVAGPLACHLLSLLNNDPGNLFRRIALLRADRHLHHLAATFDPTDDDR